MTASDSRSRSRNFRSSRRNAGSLRCHSRWMKCLTTGSAPVHVEPEEMRRAGDARVVVADRLLALPLQPIVGEIDPRPDELAQVLLDASLVLGGGRDDLRLGDRAVG